MSKRVLLVSSSPRKDGNSETLADAFAKGAREAGRLAARKQIRVQNHRREEIDHGN